MFKIKEAAHIVIAIILFAFTISFLSGFNAFLTALLTAFVVILTNVLGKKLSASYLYAEAESKIWHFQRWGWYERSYFKKPIPVGIIIPFTLSWLSWGFVRCLTLLQTEIKTTIHRAVKKRGFPGRFSELTEFHIGAIPAVGLTANLVLALLLFIFGQQIGLITEIAKFNVYYVLWNLLPLGQLDGTKVLFGSRGLWYLLSIISIIFLVFILLLM